MNPCPLFLQFDAILRIVLRHVGEQHRVPNAQPFHNFNVVHRRPSQLYRHPQVMHTTGCAQQMVRELFDAYMAQPSAMPADYAAQTDGPRAVADYIAGMTDRFATREHERLTGRRLL